MHIRVQASAVRRRRLATLATIGLAAAGLAATAGDASAWNRDRTLKQFDTLRSLHPERVKVLTRTGTAIAEDVFAAPKRDFGNWQTGPMILDPAGRLLWYKSMPAGIKAFDFRRQTYEGKPVLTWWQGVQAGGFGGGVGVIYDDHYRQIATVAAGNGQKADLHEFRLTPQGTALITAYKPIKMDLRSVGGKKNGLAMENTMQEIDIKTGKVLLEWHSNEHIRPTESYAKPPDDPTQPYDYVHMNSASVTADGNIVMSGRATHAYYKIDRTTGKFLWRMGGKRSNFKMGPHARTAWQHDVEQVSSTRFTAFDNNAAVPTPGAESRAVILKVDEAARTVRLVRAFRHPTPILAASQGNFQTLAGGHAFVGWGGDNQNMTEFDNRGKVVFDLAFLSPKVDTYRAYKAAWSGTPTGRPRIHVARSAGRLLAHMSWNGATDVATWRILAGPAGGSLTPVASVPWSDLETGKRITSDQAAFQAEALDAGGHVLARTAIVGVAAR